MSKNTKTHGSLRDQLQSHGVLLIKTQGLPSHPSQWKGDGVDHINVAMNAATQIGKWLNGRNSHTFQHPILGQFRTIENLSLFIRSESHADSIRMMENFSKIRDLISRSGGLRKMTPNYRAIMVDSVYIRVLQNEALMKLIIDSELPFDSYSVNPATMLRQRFEPAAFLCAGYTEIRNALKERRSPSLLRFLDNGVNKNADIYEGVMNQLTGDAYQGNAAEIIARFEEKRWMAYDAWCDRQASRAAQAAEAKAKKEAKAAAPVEAPAPVIQEVAGVMSSMTIARGMQPAVFPVDEAAFVKVEVPAIQEEVVTRPEAAVILIAPEAEAPVVLMAEEAGGVSASVIESTTEPVGEYSEGTRWFNPERNMTYIMVLLSTGPVWMHYSYLEESGSFDVPNRRCVSLIKDMSFGVAAMVQECYDRGLYIQNPITKEILYPVLGSDDATVTLVAEKPEGFGQDGVVMANLSSVAETDAVDEEAALDEQFAITEEAPVVQLEALHDTNAAMHQLQAEG